MQIKRKRQSSRWEPSVTKELMYSHKLVQEFRSQERFTNPHYADLWTSQSSISIQAVMFHSQQQHVSEYSNDTRTQLRLPSTRRVVCQGSRVVTWQSVTALESAVQFHAPFHRGKFSYTIKTEKIRKSRKSLNIIIISIDFVCLFVCLFVYRTDDFALQFHAFAGHLTVLHTFTAQNMELKYSFSFAFTYFFNTIT